MPDWELQDMLETKDARIAELEAQLAKAEKHLKALGAVVDEEKG